tara:strand:- start:605 stop:856 length:252 start_codon:yes stop_codon:yes gene_type:complete
MDNMTTEKLPPPTVEIVDEALIAATSMDNDDIAAETEQQPTLSLAVAGATEIAGTENDDRPPLLMLFMADGTLRWTTPLLNND